MVEQWIPNLQVGGSSPSTPASQTEGLLQLPLLNSKRTDDLKTSIHPHGDIFIGIGLCSQNGISSALPFDVLAMLLLAESASATIGGRLVCILLPDYAARAVGSRDEIQSASNRIFRLVSSFRQHYGVDCFQPLFSSAIRNHSCYSNYAAEAWSIVNQHTEGLPKAVSAYLYEQVADMAFMHKHLGCNVKIGWALDRAGGRDETWFDSQYRYYSDEITYLYAVAGRTFRPDRPRACPYLTNGEDLQYRISLIANEPADRKISEFGRKMSHETAATINHFSHIVNAFENRFGRVTGSTLGQKIESIISSLI